jgi:radical SAM protein with 4Fe4S-binding SPASM domain
MSFEMAQSIIKKEFEYVKNNESFDELQIDFMGGEPLMNFELIKQVVEWLRDANFDVPFICFATTNGTLLDDSKKEWFERNQDIIWLGVSYDGSKDTQKMNRGETANAIDYDFFYKLWPLQGIKLTISKESLPLLADSVIETQKRGFLLSASLAHGVEWSEEDAEIYISQLRILSGTYLADFSISPVNILTRLLIGIYKPAPVQKKFCGAGLHMATFDVDGKCYGCHMFSPIVLGDNAITSDNIEWTCETVAEDPRCKGCFLKDYCPTCMGFNYRYRGDLSKRDFNWCKMVLAEAIVSCEFQIKMLAAKNQPLTEEEAMYAQCAIESYPLLSSMSFRDSAAPFKRASLE